MKILIVGGGIAGITAGYFLQNNHEVTIIEKSPEWRTIGYGIGIWKSGIEILRKMPLSQAFWDSMYPVHKGATIAANGKILFQMSFDTQLEHESITYTCERDILHKAIHSLLNNVQTKFGVKLESLVQVASGVAVTLSDGAQEKFDLVVGTDGIRSQVRSMIFEEKPKSYGWNILGFWIPKEIGVFDGYCIYGGKNETILSFPYHDRHVIGLMYKSEVEAYPQTPTSVVEILEHFPTLKYRIEGIVHSIPNLKDIFVDRLRFIEMNKWSKGNVVLIGDAKHGMSPLTGIGTSMALEDAYVLSQELNVEKNVEIAFANFAKRRNKRFKPVILFKKLIENIGMVNSGTTEVIRNVLVGIMPLWFANWMFMKVFRSKI